MFRTALRTRIFFVTSAFGLFTGFAAPVLAYQPAPTLCSSAVTATKEWKSLSGFLSTSGLRLATHCAANDKILNVGLVVTDSERASHVLRGPLADGEAVETGDPVVPAGIAAENDADAFSPDVRFNRSWLQKAMRAHQFQATAMGGWSAPELGLAPLQIASR